jgi:glycine/D-amino acid oxidase-like deaminating enzyme
MPPAYNPFVKHVAVLGAGIMGVSTALFLARGGVRVTLVDAAPAICAGASRWNEGKIHLGHLYAADPSLRTAHRLLPGGLAFRPLVESLIGQRLTPAIATAGDLFLVHRRSVVDADAAHRYYEAVTRLAATHPAATHYLEPLGDARVERVEAGALDALANRDEIVAGFRVPERSVSTRWVADRLAAAVAAEPGIDVRLSTRVTGLTMGPAGFHGPLGIVTAHGTEGPFDAVVNALWEGRVALDTSAGLAPPPAWSYRYRVAVFLETTTPVTTPNAVIATGPFGDVKNYDGRCLYLSWYDTGLLAHGTGPALPSVPRLDDTAATRLADDVIARLGGLLHGVTDLASRTAARHVAGGWVVAAGHGTLDDPASTLHRRDRIGLTRHGRYLSVDTGKYSMAPWLARAVADAIL